MMNDQLLILCETDIKFELMTRPIGLPKQLQCIFWSFEASSTMPDAQQTFSLQQLIEQPMSISIFFVQDIGKAQKESRYDDISSRNDKPEPLQIHIQMLIYSVQMSCNSQPIRKQKIIQQTFIFFDFLYTNSLLCIIKIIKCLFLNPNIQSYQKLIEKRITLMDQEQYNYEEYDDGDVNNYYEQDPEVPGDYDHPSYSNDEPMVIEEKPYEIFPLTKLFSELDAILEQIRSLIYLDKGWCLQLLKEFRWDKDVLKEQYYNNMEFHLRKVGFKPDLKNPYDIDRGEIGMCGVCCSQDIRLFFNICDHNFCIDCWMEHLKNSIQSASAFPKCMAGDCPHPVLFQTISRMFAMYGQEGQIWFKKYEKKICEQFITTNQNYQFCTGIDCGNCIKVNMKLDTVSCTCSKVFCFRCQSDDHYPCKCQQKVKWMQQVMKEEADAKWISQNAKICPWCKKAVERSMGCNFMACTCGKHFCYMCSKPWQPDHKDHFKCHIYKQRPDDVVSRQKEIMEKMNHCTERYLFNQSVANNYKEIDVFSKRKQLFKMLKIDLTESEFMENAYKFAIECCQKLKWIYAFTYFHDCSKQRKQAFQFTLGEYERYKQNLLKMLAVDFKTFFQKIEEQETLGCLIYQIETWKQQFRRLKKIIVNNYNCTKNFKEKFVEELKGITQQMDKEKQREQLQKYVQSNPTLKLKTSKSSDRPQLKKKVTQQKSEQSQQSSKKGLLQTVFGSKKKKK